MPFVAKKGEYGHTFNTLKSLDNVTARAPKKKMNESPIFKQTLQQDAAKPSSNNSNWETRRNLQTNVPANTLMESSTFASPCKLRGMYREEQMAKQRDQKEQEKKQMVQQIQSNLLEQGNTLNNWATERIVQTMVEWPHATEPAREYTSIVASSSPAKQTPKKHHQQPLTFKIP